MVDQMVLRAQKWVNATYASVAGYERCAEDGQTGWQTITSLIMGVQHELGISPVVDALGPTTWRLMQAHGNFTTTSGSRFVHLIQCALYCKGYKGGQIDGNWDADTRTGAGDFQFDTFGNRFGVNNTALTPKQFRALLNMDAFVLLPGGDAKVRSVQQWLNQTYITRQDFLYVPCDGFFSRGVQEMFMYAIQYEIGMADGVANGNFGPGTRAGLRNHTLSVGSSGNWVRLFSGAMLFNRRPVIFGATFDAALAAATLAFQKFAGFDSADQTSRGDYRTWCELLVSTGDPDRPGTAADMASTITAPRAQALKAAGYRIVGRYLTNFDAHPGALDKKIKPGELDTIFKAGLRLFPIFEEGGDDESWFTETQGVDDAGRAAQAATGYGMPAGTIIYFAVDVDVTDDTITDHVIPYFAGVRQGMADRGQNRYRVGVYGTRNVCARISAEGLADLCFVAGLSTGWSGNLGFPLPQNWAFNQIDGLTVGSGPGSVDIDKNTASGRDNGIHGTSASPADQNEPFFSYVDWVHARAAEWLSLHPVRVTANTLVLQYLRAAEYNNGNWDMVAGPVSSEFRQFVDAIAYPRVRSFRDPATGKYLGVGHLDASTNSVTWNKIPDDKTIPTLCDFGGWAGDLITGMIDFHKDNPQKLPAYAFGRRYFGTDEGDALSFGWDDLTQDLDALTLGFRLIGDNAPAIGGVIRGYYGPSGDYASRYRTAIISRFGSQAQMTRAITEALAYVVRDVSFDTLRTGLLLLSGMKITDVSDADRADLSRALTDQILSRQ